MSGMNAIPAPSKEQFSIHTVNSFVELLRLFKEISSNDTILNDIAQKTANAYAITDEERKRRDNLLIECEGYDQKLETLKKEQAALDLKKIELSQLQQSNVDYLESVKASHERILTDKEADLIKREKDLSAALDKFEHDCKTLDDMKISLISKDAQQDDRERSLKDLEMKINSVKSALSIS